jgi:hypothetical protein
MSKRLFLILSTLVVLVWPGVPARAGVRISLGLRFPIFVPCCGVRAYVGPRPVYVAPAPVYVVPAPAPVYVQQAPPAVLQTPVAAPAPVYQQAVPQAAPAAASR